MKIVAFVFSFFLATAAVGPLGSVQGFTPASLASCAAVSRSQRTRAFLLQAAESSSSSETTMRQAAVSDTDTIDHNPLGLTPELTKLVSAFETIGDDKLRYKQLLYMANQLAPMDPVYFSPDNKVPGCLSTVFIHATLDKTDNTVTYTGESDGLLTKGLVALLVRGLNGNSAAAIQQVDPAFIKKAGIDASLTPGRNNGFLNMLAVMKNKAADLEAVSEQASTDSTTDDDDATADAPKAETAPQSDTPKYDAITTALTLALEPTSLTVQDISHKYKKADDDSDIEETHFSVDVVSDAFDGLNVMKRHQRIYQSLGDVMPLIQALQIQAVLTPAEVEARKS
jgi:sulfur transfer protein SufE/stress-induced morphogen